MKSILTFAVSLLLSSTALYAEDGSTGCGLGWKVAPDMSLVSATTRTTTNSSSLNQAFGTTSGTSGCKRHSIVKNFKESLQFAMINGDKLKMQMAQGNGEVIRTYASTFKCNDASRAAFNNSLKNNYDQIISHSNIGPLQVVENTVRVLKNNSELSQNCRLLAI